MAIYKAFDKNYNKLIKNKEHVFINGCFDIFHLQHLRMINMAKKQFPNCELIMGINSDYSIKQMNKKHPLIFDEKYRSEFLDELADIVVIYDGFYDYLDIISDFNIVAIVKGHEYEIKDIPEKQMGIPILYYGEDNTSSTEIYKDIINKFKNSTEI